MGKRKKPSRPTGDRGSPGTLRDLFPGNVKPLTGGAAPAPRADEAQALRRELDAARQTIAREKAEFASSMTRARQDDQRLRTVIEGLNTRIRLLEAQVKTAEQVERIQRDEAAKLGRSANAANARVQRLEAEAKVASETLDEMGRELEAAQEDLAHARERLATAEHQAEGVRLRERFVRLVDVEIPEWVDARAALMRQLGRLIEMSNALMDENARKRLDLETVVDECEEARANKALRSDLPRWEAYLEKAREARTLLDSWDDQRRRFESIVEERDRLEKKDRTLKQKAETIRRGIQRFVAVYAQIDLDLWSLTGCTATHVDLLFTGEPQVLWFAGDLQLRPVEDDWARRVEELTRGAILPPPPPPKQVHSRVAAVAQPKAAEVALLPGAIFLTQPELELERLCLILVHLRDTGGNKGIASQITYGKAILGARLTRMSIEQGFYGKVIEALDALNKRGSIARKKRMDGGRMIGYLYVQTAHTKSRAEDALAQVQGGHGDVLLERLRHALAQVTD